MGKQTLDLTPAEVHEAQVSQKGIEESSIPAVEGAEKYFALVRYKGTLVLCILDGGKWRPTSQMELMGLL